MVIGSKPSFLSVAKESQEIILERMKWQIGIDDRSGGIIFVVHGGMTPEAMARLTCYE